MSPTMSARMRPRLVMSARLRARLGAHTPPRRRLGSFTRTRACLGMILVLTATVLASPSSRADQHTPARTTTTVPAPAFFALLAGSASEVEVSGPEDGREADARAGCRYESPGLFEAVTVPAATASRPCEFVLMPGRPRLAEPWMIQRIHWSGDLHALRPDPRAMPSPLGSWRLRLMRPAPGRPRARHHVRIVAVVLIGPAGRPWQSAFAR